MGVDGWLVGNIYSTLQHGFIATARTIKTMIQTVRLKVASSSENVTRSLRLRVLKLIKYESYRFNQR